MTRLLQIKLIGISISVLGILFSQNELWAQSNRIKFDSLLTVLSNKVQAEIKPNDYRLLSMYSPKNEESIAYGEMALDLATQQNDKRAIARARLSLSNPIRRMGDLEEALDHVMSAMKTFQILEDSGGVATCLNLIGVNYINVEDYGLAIHYLGKAIEMNLGNKRRGNLMNDYNNIGESYRLWKKFDSALVNFDKSRILAIELGSQYGAAYSIGNIALVHAEQGNHKLAENMLEEAIAILNRLEDQYPLAVYCNYLADIYNERGDLTLAFRYAHLGLKIGVEEKLKEQIREASLKLSELYSQNYDYKNAFIYQYQYLLYRDSIQNEEVIANIADLRTEYEVARKQSEVDLLYGQKQERLITGLGLISGLSLASLIAYLLYRNSQRQILAIKLLEEQKEHIVESNYDKDKFFSIISHDLRGPISEFGGVAQIIRNCVLNKETGQLITVTDNIDRSINDLTNLLDNLLNWAIQRQNQFSYIPQKVNCNESIFDLMQSFSNMSAAKEISITYDIPVGMELWVDSNTTMTIFRNLVSNALKFTNRGGEVSITAQQFEGYASIWIADNGVGIPQDQMNKLMKGVSQLKGRGTESEKGLGLGFQIVQEFVQMNKGHLEIESKINRGTTIKVFLPLFRAQFIEDESLIL